MYDLDRKLLIMEVFERIAISEDMTVSLRDLYTSLEFNNQIHQDENKAIVNNAIMEAFKTNAKIDEKPVLEKDTFVMVMEATLENNDSEFTQEARALIAAQRNSED